MTEENSGDILEFSPFTSFVLITGIEFYVNNRLILGARKWILIRHFRQISSSPLDVFFFFHDVQTQENYFGILCILFIS